MSEYLQTLAGRALIEARHDAVSAARLLARWAADDLQLYRALTGEYLAGAATKAIQGQLKKPQKPLKTFTTTRPTKRSTAKEDLGAGTLESLLTRLKSEPASDATRQTKNIRTLAKSYISKRLDEVEARRPPKKPTR
ncbi:MAG: hypothetical protein ACK5XX_00655 [Holosporales bacterium]|jgi:hypothetical protein